MFWVGWMDDILDGMMVRQMDGWFFGWDGWMMSGTLGWVGWFRGLK